MSSTGKLKSPNLNLCRQGETLVDNEKIADPAFKYAQPFQMQECLYLTTPSDPSMSRSGVLPGSKSGSVGCLSPERPKFDLNFEVISKSPCNQPPFGINHDPNPECKIFRARSSPFVKHLSSEDRERYLYHLGSIQDSEIPELKKEIELRRKIEDLIGIKLDSLKKQ